MPIRRRTAIGETPGPVQVRAAIVHLTLDPGLGYQVVQPVQRAQHRGLTASGRAE